MSEFHNFSMTNISGELIDFSSYADQLCLVVNVASR